MKKKVWITALIVVAVIIAVMAYTHYTPFWLSVTNLVFIGIGFALEIVVRYLYNRFIKEKD